MKSISKWLDELGLGRSGRRAATSPFAFHVSDTIDPNTIAFVQGGKVVGVLTDVARLCPTCKSTGFPVSTLGLDRCNFCDGTEGGQDVREG